MSQSSSSECGEIHAFWLLKSPGCCYTLFFRENYLGEIRFHSESPQTMQDYKDIMLKADTANDDPSSLAFPLYTLFPWRTGEELTFIRDYQLSKKDCRWQDLWSLSFEQIWPPVCQQRSRHRDTFESRRFIFFAHHVCAVWKISEEKRYLVHLRSSWPDNEFDYLNDGFLFMPEDIVDEQLLLNADLRLLSDQEKLNQYPWKTGAEGRDVIFRFANDPHMTVTKLMKSRKTVKPRKNAFVLDLTDSHDEEKEQKDVEEETRKRKVEEEPVLVKQDAVQPVEKKIRGPQLYVF